MQVTVNIDGKAGLMLTEGMAVLIACVVYRVEEDKLEFLFPDSADREENAAILRKFKVLRDDMQIE